MSNGHVGAETLSVFVGLRSSKELAHKQSVSLSAIALRLSRSGIHVHM